ncbi:3-oxoacyl-[acyl-carrier-protein] reductase FabG-like [Galleria mellonella]|uniref:3-oxoacyl-[acyl-carrier-protein] reductase FabG-like n=1 Tax=Galleria mellonella TaxID=7137 RepID=A0ABM3MUP8_GALME|nr:3-oxoacyl-[acyl-carrier-protein] reductase FabG-like [Galleria mellonella]
MEADLSDKVVLVTGASAGIGRAAALLLARCGARLALAGRDERSLRAAADSCARAAGRAALALPADLACDRGCRLVAAKTIEHFGRLDVLVNNAAITARCTIQTTDMETFDRVFAVNIRGVYNLTRLLVPELIKSRGNIINVSSIVGSTVSIGQLPYAMAKAALDYFSRLIAVELAPFGVRVNTVSPGITVSKMVQRVTNYTDEQYQEFLKEAATTIPLGEVCVGEDIAKMIVHLASDNSRLVTGVNVQVDGGLQYTNDHRLIKKQVQ